MEKFKKLLEKKRQMGKSLDGVERDAKMSAVQSLKDMANEAMKGKIDGMKKVTVASDSSEGLEHGMDKAKELIKGREGMADLGKLGEDEMDDMGEASEDKGHYDDEFGPESDDASPNEETPEEDDMSHEDIDKELERLMAKKKKLSK